MAEQWWVGGTRSIAGNALDQLTLGWGCISLIGEDENALQTTVELVMRDMAQVPASGWRGSEEMSGPQAPSGSAVHDVTGREEAVHPVEALQSLGLIEQSSWSPCRCKGQQAWQR